MVCVSNITEVSESNAEEFEGVFMPIILRLVQGAELPRNGAYLKYVSTEVSESNAEIVQNNGHKKVS